MISPADSMKKRSILQKNSILEKFKKQEKSIYYEPISAREQQSPERGKRSKNKDYER